MSDGTFIPQDVSAHQQTAWKAILAKIKKIETGTTATTSSAQKTSPSAAAAPSTITAFPVTGAYTSIPLAPLPCVVYEITTGVVSKADCSVTASANIIGLATAFASAKSTVTIWGDVTYPAWNWNVGPVFLGLNGALTQSPLSTPGAKFLCIVGFAISAKTIFVSPQEPIYFSASSSSSLQLTAGGSLTVGTIGSSGFVFVSNPALVVSSTTPNNVVDTRPVLAGTLVEDQILECKVRAFLAGTNGAKSVLVGIDADLSNALTAVFSAGQAGIVEFTAQLMVNSASPHLLYSRADFQQQYAGGGIKRGSVTVDLATTDVSLLTEAWVANAADSITIDSIAWTLKGNGL